MDFPLSLTSQLIAETQTFVKKVINDTFICPMLLRWSGSRDDLQFLHVILDSVCKEVDYQNIIKPCMEAIAPFIPASSGVGILEKAARQVLM